MAEERNDTSPGGEDVKPGSCTARNCLVACIPFVVGLAAALVIGWWIYPALLFAERHQPVDFNHQAHLVKLGMACSDCHTLRDDGSFRGLPTTSECATCHSGVQSDSPREKKFIDDYVAKGRELPWRVRQKQPANVYFSHAAHSVDNCNACHDFATAELCNLCHVDVARTTNSLPVFENRMTGYSAATMKMDRCESCHAQPDHLRDTSANNACFVCHK
jgi:hypothetical protein